MSLRKEITEKEIRDNPELAEKIKKEEALKDPSGALQEYMVKYWKVIDYEQEEVEKLKDIDKFQVFGKKISKPRPETISFFKWTNRIASGVGGSLIFVGTSEENNNYIEAGGVIAILSPLLESVLSTWQDKLEKDLEEQKKLFQGLKNLEKFYEGTLLHTLDTWNDPNISPQVKKALNVLKEKVEKLEEKLRVGTIEGENKLERGRLVEKIKLSDYCKNDWDDYCAKAQPVADKVQALIDALKLQSLENHESRVEIPPK